MPGASRMFASLAAGLILAASMVLGLPPNDAPSFAQEPAETEADPSRAEGCRYRVGIFDTNDDGEAGHLIQVDEFSGTGAECDRPDRDLLDFEETRIAPGAERDLLLQLQGVDVEGAYPHQRCKDVSRWISHEGRILFESEYGGEQPRSGDDLDLDHPVRSIRNGEAANLCYAIFTVRPPRPR